MAVVDLLAEQGVVDSYIEFAQTMRESLYVPSALVSFDAISSTYVYTVGCLAEGPYTAAFSCQGADDDPMADDDIVFSGVADVDIVAGEETVHDF